MVNVNDPRPRGVDIPISKSGRLMTIALLALSLPRLVLAQAPVPDLAGYPSGLAGFAVVAYYGVSSDKDNLPNRRRAAVFGIEHLFRDRAIGPRLNYDAYLKGVIINRNPWKRQRYVWGRLRCGQMPSTVDDSVPWIDGHLITEKYGTAFQTMPNSLRLFLEKETTGFGTDGHWLAAVAAFCQVVRKLPSGVEVLETCREYRDSPFLMSQVYFDLRDVIKGRTNCIDLPDIRGQFHMLESIFVRADTWEGGGYPVYIKCSTFLAVLGYAVGYSYGELMIAAHRHLQGADWSAIVGIDFRQELEIGSTMDEVLVEIARSLKESGFTKRECHIRVVGHRLGDTLASLVAGAIIASLVSLGSTCGSWIAVTSAAIADPKPVAGFTSAAWGYEIGRRSHLESRASYGNGAVSLKSSSGMTSFQLGVCHDVIWQVVVGVVSCAALLNKFTLRKALGFGTFVVPTVWLYWLGTAMAGLAIIPSLKVPLWAWKNGEKSSFLVGCSLPAMTVAMTIIRAMWPDVSVVWKFWFTDGVTWLYCIFGASMSMYLGEATEYPMTGYLWPSIWLLALSSSVAGSPRAVE
jgi:hypothetical protein